MEYHLDRVEFYITNVCNYSCKYCNRFNNYHFTGHQYWKDYANVYLEWSKFIDFNYISILGGEPLLNPSINQWITNIRKLWSKSTIEIVTNGSRLNKVNDLYKTIVNNNEKQTFIHIGLHNLDLLSSTMIEVDKFLTNPIIEKIPYDDLDHRFATIYKRSQDKEWPECKSLAEYKTLPKKIQEKFNKSFNKLEFIETNSFIRAIDQYNVRIDIHIEDVFHRSALIRDDNLFKLHNSNPSKAHSICNEKNNHHFIKGKLYKCNVSGVLPEFYKQFQMEISKSDAQLIKSYVPLNINDTNETIKSFIEDLPNKIPQCKFCPEWLDSCKLNPTTKKTKVIKKHK